MSTANNYGAEQLAKRTDYTVMLLEKYTAAPRSVVRRLAQGRYARHALGYSKPTGPGKGNGIMRSAFCSTRRERSGGFRSGPTVGARSDSGSHNKSQELTGYAVLLLVKHSTGTRAAGRSSGHKRYAGRKIGLLETNNYRVKAKASWGRPSAQIGGNSQVGFVAARPLVLVAARPA